MNQPQIDALPVNWKTIAEDLADSLADFNHNWIDETRGSMYRHSHEAMIAYYEAAGFDWKAWRKETNQKVCKCHP
mgnify:FL=1